MMDSSSTAVVGTTPAASRGGWKRWGAALALAAGSCGAQAVTVDLLLLYDSYSQNYFNGQPQTALRSWVDQVNTMYVNSGIDIQLRLVGTQLNNVAASDMGDVLERIRSDSAVARRRDELGADFVAQIHQSGECGIGYVAVRADVAFNVVGPTCGPYTLAHELGHNMGLSHSRRQGDTGGARYAYALGHGVDRLFGTIMTYAFLFNAPRIPQFSNPRQTCKGVPCGVPEGQPEQADAVKALNNVRTELANFRPTRVGGPTEPPTNPGTTLANGVYLVKAKHSGKCMDVDNARQDEGRNVFQWTCHGGNNQRWIFTNLNNGYYEVKVKHSGKCLDVDHSGTSNGVNVHQWSCNRSTAQQWKPVANSDGSYRMVARVSGKVLDVAGGSMSNAGNIQQWDSLSSANQNWTLQRVE
ncbi:RICIN domain-containing protein [Eleftheria terrae]|uniref:RICIN domain-containing protein n=1 Tax=Eleftheria terrae TaxID=1597781 RepID=UPI00263ADFF7|nr:RICIN domain-containing protein [Eleftheria terrae]WKB50585.1 RICIN domain-containing protein [Eleftheria terrae]